MMFAIGLGLKLLKRQWGGKLIPLLSFSFSVCIALMSGMNGLGTRLGMAMNQEASTLMGADLLLTSSRPIRSEFVDKADELELKHTVLVEFLTMSLFKDTPILATVKAVESPYPLLGSIELTQPSTHPLPESGYLWLHADWHDRFGVNVNDEIHIGRISLKVENFIKQEPDVGANIFNIAPRIIMNQEDLAQTQVIQPGSRVEYRLQLTGDGAALAQYLDWVKPQMSSNEQIINLKEDRPELANTIERAERYLILVAFCSILLAGTTILLVLREYAQAQERIVSLLRTFGVNKQQLLMIYFGSLLVLGLIFGIIGTTLGYGLQSGVAYILTTRFGILLPKVPFFYQLIGIITSLVLMTGFSVPFLSQLVKQSPLSIFHAQAKTSATQSFTFAFCIAAALLMILILYTKNIQFSLSTFACLIILFFVATAFLSLMIRLLQKIKPWIRSPYKLSLSRLALHQKDNVVQILGLSLSLTLILLLTFVRFDLMKQWEKTFPENPPNHYIFNILPDEVPTLISMLDKNNISHTDFFPIVKARLTEINNKPINLNAFPPGEIPNYLKRELNNTALDTPRDIDHLTKGQWWNNHVHENLVSVEQSIADTLQLNIGDTLTFTVADKKFTSSIANIRTVQWENFQPNFYMIFSEHALQDFPRTYLSSMRILNNPTILREIAQSFPSVTVISVSDVLTEMKRIITESSQYMGGLLLLILVTSIILLYTTNIIQLQSRVKESNILLRLGVSRKQLRLTMMGEHFVSSFLASAIAFIVASILIYILGKALFEVGSAYLPFMYFPICLGAVFIICILTTRG